VTLSEAVGVNLFYKRCQGNPNHPEPGENDNDLRRSLVMCRQRRLRQSGKPVMNRRGALVWLSRMPLGYYGVNRMLAAAACCTVFSRWSSARARLWQSPLAGCRRVEHR
jgi:hypothetical protein